MSTLLNKASGTNTLIPFCYAIGFYFLALGSLVYFIVFSSGMYAPLSVNNQQVEQPLAVAMSGNIFLLLLFGFQHSLMARKRFKAWLFNYLPRSVERATYCLATSVVLFAIVYFWFPMKGDIWQVTSASTALIVQGLGGAGWLLLVLATFQIGHFELFGLKQTFAPLVGKEMPEPAFKTPGLYKLVRHPIQLGVLIGIWVVPVSSLNHLVLALGMTIYIFVGLYFEEKDLIREFGNTYRAYKKRVGKVIPFVG